MINELKLIIKYDHPSRLKSSSQHQNLQVLDEWPHLDWKEPVWILVELLRDSPSSCMHFSLLIIVFPFYRVWRPIWWQSWECLSLSSSSALSATMIGLSPRCYPIGTFCWLPCLSSGTKLLMQLTESRQGRQTTAALLDSCWIIVRIS